MLSFSLIFLLSLSVPELRAQHDRDAADVGRGAQPARGRGHRVRILGGQSGLAAGELEERDPELGFELQSHFVQWRKRQGVPTPRSRFVTNYWDITYLLFRFCRIYDCLTNWAEVFSIPI